MSAFSGIDIALWDLKGRTGFSLKPRCSAPELTRVMVVARKLGVPIYQLLGGKVRDTIKVYAWIGGDRPSDVERQA